MVLALEDSQKLGLAAGQARRCRQPFEIVGLEGRRLIRTLQRVVCLTPRTTSVVFAAVFKIIHLNYARAEPSAGPIFLVWHDRRDGPRQLRDPAVLVSESLANAADVQRIDTHTDYRVAAFQTCLSGCISTSGDPSARHIAASFG